MKQEKQFADAIYERYKECKQEIAKLKSEKECAYEAWRNTMSSESYEQYEQIEKKLKYMERVLDIRAHLIVEQLYEKGGISCEPN